MERMASHRRTVAGGWRGDCCAWRAAGFDSLAGSSEGFIARLRRNGRLLTGRCGDRRRLPSVPPGLGRRSHGDSQGKGDNGVQLGVGHEVLLFTSNVWVDLEIDPRASSALTYDFVEGAAPVTPKMRMRCTRPIAHTSAAALSLKGRRTPRPSGRRHAEREVGWMPTCARGTTHDDFGAGMHA